MWARVVVLMLLVPSCRVHDLEDEAEEYKNADFYDNYEETEASMPMLTTTAMESFTRVRRYGTSEKKRTLDPQELREVKDVLRDIFANRRIESGAAAEFTKTSPSKLVDSTGQSDTSYDQSFKTSPYTETLYNQTEQYKQSEQQSTSSSTSKDSLNNTAINNVEDTQQLHTGGPLVSDSTYTTYPFDWLSTEQDLTSINDIQEERSILKEAVKRLNRRVEIWEPQDVTNTILTTLLNYLDNSTERTLNPQEIKAVDDALKRFVSGQKLAVTRSSMHPSNTSTMPEYAYAGQNTESGSETMMSTVTDVYEITEYGETYQNTDNLALRQLSSKKRRKKKKKKKPAPPKNRIPSGMYIKNKFYTFPPGWPFDLTQCPTTDTTPYKLDIRGMLKILANLTYEYDMNLVEKFNESMFAYSIPTCPTNRYGFGVAFGKGARSTVLDFDNTTVVAKCFVCGLKASQIPQDAYCGDAFAGDFLPLVPVDPRARGHIAKYRKYCRYIDSREPIELPEFPRAVYGRFSGGCSVRWTDLSGVYTQRTCRSKRRAVTGNHFGSKRMAKLEMALNHLDNGCIISPMATLLPLSRGISLYARFHACVCTGAWCNIAKRDVPWMTNIIITFCLYNIFKKE